MWFESFYANVQLSKEFNFVNQKMSLAVTWNRNRPSISTKSPNFTFHHRKKKTHEDRIPSH